MHGSAVGTLTPRHKAWIRVAARSSRSKNAGCRSCMSLRRLRNMMRLISTSRQAALYALGTTKWKPERNRS